MNITNVINTVSAGVAAATAAAGGDAAGAEEKTAAGAAGEKDMFLKLLVTQLKHQDPLEPQDGTQFVTQLAQFNSLDQLMGIRSTLERLAKAAEGAAAAGDGAGAAKGPKV